MCFSNTTKRSLDTNHPNEANNHSIAATDPYGLQTYGLVDYIGGPDEDNNSDSEHHVLLGAWIITVVVPMVAVGNEKDEPITSSQC